MIWIGLIWPVLLTIGVSPQLFFTLFEANHLKITHKGENRMSGIDHFWNQKQ